MSSVIKKMRLTIRLSKAEFETIKRAAQITQAERGERVDESALVRELAMPRIRKIVAQAEQVAA